MKQKKPKILLYDIETEPNLAWVWGKYQQDAIAIEKEWQILSVAWKWYGEKNIFFKRRGKTDRNVCSTILDLFNRADLVVAHNGKNFDNKKVNARLAYWGFPPPPPYASIDTLQIARRYFKFTSNRLADLAKFLGLRKKIKTAGWELWAGCLRNDPKSWAIMEKYNKQDVRVLEDLYNTFLPWIQDHPNLSLLFGNRLCPKCGSRHISKQGRKTTHKGLQQQYKCLDCLGWFTASVPTGKLKYKENLE